MIITMLSQSAATAWRRGAAVLHGGARDVVRLRASSIRQFTIHIPYTYTIYIYIYIYVYTHIALLKMYYQKAKWYKLKVACRDHRT